MQRNVSDKDAPKSFRQRCKNIFPSKLQQNLSEKMQQNLSEKMQQKLSNKDATKFFIHKCNKICPTKVHTYIYKITNLHLCRSNSRRHCVLGLLISHILLKITQCAKQHTHYEKKHREKHILKKVLGVNIGYVVITFVPRNRKLNTFSKALNRI